MDDDKIIPFPANPRRAHAERRVDWCSPCHPIRGESASELLRRRYEAYLHPGSDDDGPAAA